MPVEAYVIRRTNPLGEAVSILALGCETMKPTPLSPIKPSRVVTLLALCWVGACTTSTDGGEPTVAAVVVSPATGAVAVGATIQLVATVKDANDQPVTDASVTWSSTNTGTATVSGTGMVRGISAGHAEIDASADGTTGSASINVTTVTPPPPPPPTPPGPINHVFIVVEENHDYTSVMGSSSMPYLNSLANQYGLATQYYGNTHPSIGNYFMMTVGKTITNDDLFKGVVSDDNIVRQLVKAGKTWKVYAEDLPSVGYHSPHDNGNYVAHHNPLPYFSDVVNDADQYRNLVPFTQFAGDVAGSQFPHYSFIVPNACNDAHDCSLSIADGWLKTNIDPLVKSASFQKDGLLILVFDESETDSTRGGGRIVCILIGTMVKPGFKSTTVYQHQSLLRLTAKALGLGGYPNAAATAPDMTEFFKP